MNDCRQVAGAVSGRRRPRSGERCRAEPSGAERCRAGRPRAAGRRGGGGEGAVPPPTSSHPLAVKPGTRRDAREVLTTIQSPPMRCSNTVNNTPSFSRSVAGVLLTLGIVKGRKMAATLDR